MTSEDIFPAPAAPRIPVLSGGAFPVRRIFCIGKNYADHVAEMGGNADRDPPVYFTKPADAIVTDGRAVPYPPATDNLHFEGELVIALKSGGAGISVESAAAHVFGFAAGCDLTRRDLQAAAKKAGAPWDAAKAFDNAAPVGTITRGLPARDARLKTFINGERRQDAVLSEMIWSVEEIISALSAYVELRQGDIIFTGTPAGVGPLSRGDRVKVDIEGAPALEFVIR